MIMLSLKNVVQTSEVSTAYGRIRTFWNLPEFLPIIKHLNTYGKYQSLGTCELSFCKGSKFPRPQKEDCCMNIQPSCAFIYMQSEVFLKCEWKSMTASNNMEKSVVVYLPHLPWVPVSANCSQSEKLTLKSAVLEFYK